MSPVKCKLVESMKCAGKWKVWVVTPTQRGWFAGEKAYANRLNAERAVQRQYDAEGTAYEFMS